MGLGCCKHRQGRGGSSAASSSQQAGGRRRDGEDELQGRQPGLAGPVPSGTLVVVSAETTLREDMDGHAWWSIGRHLAPFGGQTGKVVRSAQGLTYIEFVNKNDATPAEHAEPEPAPTITPESVVLTESHSAENVAGSGGGGGCGATPWFEEETRVADTSWRAADLTVVRLTVPNTFLQLASESQATELNV